MIPHHELYPQREQKGIMLRVVNWTAFDQDLGCFWKSQSNLSN
jgi:hypothetical protein